MCYVLSKNTQQMIVVYMSIEYYIYFYNSIKCTNN